MTGGPLIPFHRYAIVISIYIYLLTFFLLPITFFSSYLLIHANSIDSSRFCSVIFLLLIYPVNP